MAILQTFNAILGFFQMIITHYIIFYLLHVTIRFGCSFFIDATSNNKETNNTTTKKNQVMRLVCIEHCTMWKKVFDLPYTFCFPCISENVKTRIIRDMRRFYNQKDFYEERNMNHSLEMVFMGDDDVGTMSTIYALAAHFSRDVMLVNLGDVSKSSDLLNILNQPNKIIVIDGLDNHNISSSIIKASIYKQSNYSQNRIIIIRQNDLNVRYPFIDYSSETQYVYVFEKCNRNQIECIFKRFFSCDEKNMNFGSLDALCMEFVSSVPEDTYYIRTIEKYLSKYIHNPHGAVDNVWQLTVPSSPLLSIQTTNIWDDINRIYDYSIPKLPTWLETDACSSSFLLKPNKDIIRNLGDLEKEFENDTSTFRDAIVEEDDDEEDSFEHVKNPSS